MQIISKLMSEIGSYLRQRGPTMAAGNETVHRLCQSLLLTPNSVPLCRKTLHNLILSSTVNF